MTALIQSYHTHAKGEEQGWFASVTHPAHWLDRDKLKLDTTTPFRIQLGPFKFLEEARHAAMVDAVPRLDRVHRRLEDESSEAVTDGQPDSPAEG